MTRYALVTFDVYSALFDIAGSLTPPLRRLSGLGEAEAAAAFALWRAKQLERAAISTALGLAHTSFREATRQALAYVERRYKLSLSEEQRRELVMAWDRLTPWPEAPEVLKTLKARGYALAILSNGDRDMLKAVADSLPVAFDHIFSCEEAGHYKPHPEIYALPVRKLNLERTRILHVAGGSSDALGAVAAGLPCYWSNRTGDAVLDPAFAPTYDRPDLSGLLEILT
ncbi:MAG: haloacid dehalogenase type II [Hyphomicrobiaceae bacterium]